MPSHHFHRNGFQVEATQAIDVDEQAKLLHGWQQQYQQLGCGLFQGSLATADADQFTIINETANKALHQIMAVPQGQIVIGMCEGDFSAHTLNGRALNRDCLMMMDELRQHDVRTSGEVDVAGIAVSRELFFSQVHEQEHGPVQALLDASVLQLKPNAATMLRHCLRLLAQQLHQPRADGSAAPGMSPRALASTAVSNIALALAMSQDGLKPEPLSRSRQRRERVVFNAIDYMHAHAGDEIGILDVCLATHVSRRTLQYCFEERLQISPLQYLKTLRLNSARRQLKHMQAARVAHVHQHTIANVAAQYGYNHSSRFAADYRKLFGELPSQLDRAH